MEAGGGRAGGAGGVLRDGLYILRAFCYGPLPAHYCAYMKITYDTISTKGTRKRPI